MASISSGVSEGDEPDIDSDAVDLEQLESQTKYHSSARSQRYAGPDAASSLDESLPRCRSVASGYGHHPQPMVRIVAHRPQSHRAMVNFKSPALLDPPRRATAGWVCLTRTHHAVQGDARGRVRRAQGQVARGNLAYHSMTRSCRCGAARVPLPSFHVGQPAPWFGQGQGWTCATISPTCNPVCACSACWIKSFQVIPRGGLPSHIVVTRMASQNPPDCGLGLSIKVRCTSITTTVWSPAKPMIPMNRTRPRLHRSWRPLRVTRSALLTRNEHLVRCLCVSDPIAM